MKRIKTVLHLARSLFNSHILVWLISKFIRMLVHLAKLPESVEHANQKKYHYNNSNSKNIGKIHGTPLYLIILKYAPNPRIEGTHKPTKSPSSLYPENHK